VNPRFLPQAAAARSVRHTPSDARLVELARTGSEPAFEAIVARYRVPLVRHCARMVGDADAEDAAQDALLNAHAALVRGAVVRQLAPWLYAIAQNTARNCLRARASRSAIDDADRDRGAPADGSAEDRQELREVLAAVSSLPDRQRDAIVMREFEGRSYEEIASRLGASHGAVRQLLNRARGSVRERIRVLVPVEPFVRWALSRSSGGNAAGGATLSGACVLGAKVCVVALLPATVALTAPAPRHAAATRSARPTTRRIHIRTAALPSAAGTVVTGIATEQRVRSHSTSTSAYTRSLRTDGRTRRAPTAVVRKRHSSPANRGRSAGHGAAHRPGSAGRQDVHPTAAPSTLTSTPSNPPDVRTAPPHTLTVPRVPGVSSDSPSPRNPRHANPAGGPAAAEPPASFSTAGPPGRVGNGARGPATPSPDSNHLTQPTAAPSAGSDATVGERPGPHTAPGTPGSGEPVRSSSPSLIASGDFSAAGATGGWPSAGNQRPPGASAQPGGSGVQPAGGRNG